MNQEKSHTNTSLKYVYFIGSTIYAFLIYTSTRYLSPLEDLGLSEMFRKGEWYGIAGVRLIEGRFNVLLGLDVFLLQKLHELFPMTNTTYGIKYFYFIIAFSFCVAAFAAHKIIITTLKDKGRNLAYGMMLLIYFSPIFVYTNFRLLFTERYLFLVFLLLVLAIVQYEKSKKYRFILFIFILANFGIHLKEVSLLSIGCLTVFYGYRYLINRQENKRDGIISALLFISCGVYVLLYFIYIKPLIGERYGASDTAFIHMMIRNVYRWLITQPFLLLLFLPINAKYIYDIIIRKEKPDIYHLIGMMGTVFMFGYFILKINPNEYYLAPVYAFALFTICSEIARHDLLNRMWFKLVVTFCFLIHINSITFGVSEILFQKFNNKNFYTMVLDLDQMIDDHDKKQGEDNLEMNVYVPDCLYFGKEGIMLYPVQVLIEYMQEGENGYQILPYCNYEMPDSIPAESEKSPVKGDYIVYTPYSQIDLEDFQESDLKLIKHYKAPYRFQEYNIPYLIKRLMSKEKIVKNSMAYSAVYAVYLVE